MKRDQFQDGSPHHPADEQLIDYLAKRLDEADRQSIQAHLVECDRCLAAFKEVGDFFEPQRDNEPMITEDIELEWRTFWNRIKDNDEATAASDQAENQPPQRRRLGFWLNPAVSIALAVLVVAIAVGMWAIQQRRANRQLARQLEVEQLRTTQLEIEQQNLADRTKELEQENSILLERSRSVEQSQPSRRADLKPPEINAPIYDLYPRGFVRRSENEGEVNRIKVPPAAKSITLILNSEGIKVFPSYKIEIRDGNRAAWRGSGLERGSYGNFSITLDPAFLGKGTFKLRLYGPASEQLAEYLLRIE
jgi:hypothetical protein